MFVLKMDQHQVSNLKEFLSRVTMKGNEAIAYVELLNIIQNAQPLPVKEGGETNEPTKEVPK